MYTIEQVREIIKEAIAKNELELIKEITDNDVKEFNINQSIETHESIFNNETNKFDVNKLNKKYVHISDKIDIKLLDKEDIYVNLHQINKEKNDYAKEVFHNVFFSKLSKIYDELFMGEKIIASDLYAVKTDACYIFFFIMFKEKY